MRQRRVISRIYQWITGKLPQRWAGYADYYLRPRIRTRWGGAFNGQQVRQQVFKRLAAAGSFEAMVETGTYTGITTKFLAETCPTVPVFSVEVNPRYHMCARLNLRRWDNVQLFNMDTRQFLGLLKNQIPRKQVFFYLDAHWDPQDLPLVEELRTVFGHWEDPVVIIDDFEVPGMPGYSFDDYPGGGRLCLEALPPEVMNGLAVFFPSVSPEKETGSKRGWVVMVRTSSPLTAHLRSMEEITERSLATPPPS